MLPNADFKINVLCPVNVVVNIPLLAQVGSASPKVKGSTLMGHSICAPLRHQRGKSTIVLSFFIGTDKEHVHERMHITGRISSSTSMFLSLTQTSKSCPLLLEPGRHYKHLPSRHYRKLMWIGFRDVDTNIYSSILYSGRYRSSPPVPPNGFTGMAMNEVSVEISLRKSENSTRSRN